MRAPRKTGSTLVLRAFVGFKRDGGSHVKCQKVSNFYVILRGHA